jgi:hypothetical protein
MLFKKEKNDKVKEEIKENFLIARKKKKKFIKIS